MKIYLGFEQKGWLAAEVLRFSLEKHISEPVEFKEVRHLHLKLDQPLLPGSPVYRWFIPYFEGYQGKVLYLDGTNVCLKDLTPLFKLLDSSKGAIASPVTQPEGTNGFYAGALLMDCAKLKSWDPLAWSKSWSKGVEGIQKTMWALPEAPNHEAMTPFLASEVGRDSAFAETYLLDYANPLTRPWVQPNHPEKKAFLSLLKEAIVTERIPLETLLLEIQAGHIYPQIIEDAMKWG